LNIGQCSLDFTRILGTSALLLGKQA